MVLPGLDYATPGDSNDLQLSSTPSLSPSTSEGKAQNQGLTPFPPYLPSLVRENVRFPVSVAAAGGLEGE